MDTNLIAIDENEESLVAFEFYANHLHRQGNRIVLVHVVEPHLTSSNHFAMQKNAMREVTLINEKLKVQRLQEQFEDLMRIHRIPGRINVIYYSREPGKTICEVAAEENCSMIVVGVSSSRELNLLKPLPSSLGSTIDYILKKATCPVVIARTPTTGTSVSTPTIFTEPSLQSLPVTPNARIRKISCPIIGLQMSTTPPNYGLLTSIHGTGTAPASITVLVNGKSETKQASDGHSKESKGPEKMRRHSTVINPFRQLSLLNGFKKTHLLVPEQQGELKKARSERSLLATQHEADETKL